MIDAIHAAEADCRRFMQEFMDLLAHHRGRQTPLSLLEELMSVTIVQLLEAMRNLVVLAHQAAQEIADLRAQLAAHGPADQASLDQMEATIGDAHDVLGTALTPVPTPTPTPPEPPAAGLTDSTAPAGGATNSTAAPQSKPAGPLMPKRR